MSVPKFQSADYLSYLAKKEIDDRIVKLSRKILERVKEKRFERGANPIGIVAAALYFACNINGYKITQKELAITASVSELTIRNNCKMIKNLLSSREFHGTSA